MDIGARLRQAREQRGLALPHLSTTTKIPLRMLEALERNDFSALPGGIFTRGFLRAYAGALGLDPEEAVREFIAQTRDTPDPGDDNKGRQPALPEDVSPAANTLLLAGGVVLAAGAILYFAGGPAPSAVDSTADRPIAVAGTAQPASDEPAVAQTATTGETPSAVGAPEPAGLRLEMEPRGLCWVEVTADGRRALYRLVQGGERETIDAQGELILRVGDAGAFAFRINGVPGRPLGQSGQVVILRITGENYRNFLER